MPAQIDSFRHLRHLHDRIELLRAVATLALPPEAEARRRALLGALCPADMTREIARNIATGPAPAEVDRFLKSLAQYAPVPKPALKV